MSSAIGIVTTLLKLRHEELIIWWKAECYELQAIQEALQTGRKKRRKDVQPGLGGDLNLGPPEWHNHTTCLEPHSEDAQSLWNNIQWQILTIHTRKQYRWDMNNKNYGLPIMD